MAEALKAATYLEHDDELEKNFEGQRDNYKRSPRKLGTEVLDNSELQEYQGVLLLLLLFRHTVSVEKLLFAIKCIHKMCCIDITAWF